MVKPYLDTLCKITCQNRKFSGPNLAKLDNQKHYLKPCTNMTNLAESTETKTVKSLGRMK